VDKHGQWHLNEETGFLLNADDPERIKLEQTGDTVALVAGERSQQLVSLSSRESMGPVDVVFPVLHGPFGEDGTVQGLLKLAGVPFVGAGVLGSAVGMDKDVMKRLLRDAGIPVGNFIVIDQVSSQAPATGKVVEELGLPLFVKPANLGSSVGISKAHSTDELASAVAEALKYDRKVLVEEYIEGREIECAVLGNEDPVASVPGEIIPQAEFYSYEAKYIDEDGALLKIPAELPPEAVKRIRDLALKTFKVLCCEGMARVDCFLTSDGKAIVNEINTIPGFTRISMYPRLFEASGIPYSELIDRLIQLALERYDQETRLRTSWQ
jgi:D-alanine-D-alanine ligase